MSNERTAPRKQKVDQSQLLPHPKPTALERETAVNLPDLNAILQRAFYHRHIGTGKDVVTLQRALGNRVVGQLIGHHANIPSVAGKSKPGALQDGQGEQSRPSRQTNSISTQDTFFRSLANDHVNGQTHDQAQHHEIQHSGAHQVIQRLPSNNNNPTMQPNGTYWDRQNMDGAWGNVPGRITAIMKKPGNGGVPSVAPPGWDWLQKKVGRLKGKWVRFHIINQYLGGPGNQTWNLVPTTVAVNGAYNREIEEDAKENAIDNNKWTYVDVQLVYNYNWPARIPSAVSAEWGSWNGNAWAAANAKVYQNYDITQFGMGAAYLRGHNITQGQVGKRGVPSRHVAAFTEWLKTYRQDDDQDSDEDMDFDTAAQKNDDFGHDYDSSWLNKIWLDEDDTAPGQLQPVVQAL